MNKFLRFFVCVGLAWLVLAPFVMAAPPQTINYQGFLANSAGVPVNSTTTQLTFKLYDANNAVLWTEVQPNVTVTNGVFNVLLGSAALFSAATPSPLIFDKQYFLGVTVNQDAEMTPRQALHATPYAIRAATVDTAAAIPGAQITGPITADFGNNNTAIGVNALQSSPGAVDGGACNTGSDNTAIGVNALQNNVQGTYNIAIGNSALLGNTGGCANTAVGISTLIDNTGSRNIAIGRGAGGALTTGSNNIDIGNAGVAGEGNTIRIGDNNQTRAFISGIRGKTTGVADAIPVVIDSNGQLGTVSSSRRFKDEITDMGAESSALMKLRPVTFHYKADQGPAGRTLQYGLVAEEVAEIAPGLVAHSADGKIETVYYQFLAPMLLNEYQKLQRTIQAQALEMTKQTALIVELQQDRQVQTARIKALEEQASEIAALKQHAAKMAAALERLGNINIAGK